MVLSIIYGMPLSTLISDCDDDVCPDSDKELLFLVGVGSISTILTRHGRMLRAYGELLAYLNRVNLALMVFSRLLGENLSSRATSGLICIRCPLNLTLGLSESVYLRCCGLPFLFYFFFDRDLRLLSERLF